MYYTVGRTLVLKMEGLLDVNPLCMMPAAESPVRSGRTGTGGSRGGAVTASEDNGV